MSLNIDLLNPSLIETTLSTVFDLFKQKTVTTPSDRARFDFILKGEEGDKTAIEVKSHNINPYILSKLKESLTKTQGINKFILITPETPTESQINVFNDIFNEPNIECKWFGIKEFLLQNYNIDIKNSLDLMNLQTAAITSKYELYPNELIGNDIITYGPVQSPSEDSQSKPKSDEYTRNKLIKSISEQDNKQEHNHLLTTLRRQFPDSILAKLPLEEESLANRLFIGKKYDDAIIVLTDIKNFSKIVSAAEPNDLNESMSKYYTNARDLVFKYNGILDKFIGDAVLAVFNFPQKNNNSYIEVVKFCAELILLGNEILNDLSMKIDQSISTGTRIGISNGPLYTLNIGSNNLEVTFIGDKINFAARLEKKCNPDGVLISNRFYHKLREQHYELLRDLKIDEIEIDPADAKGQAETTKAWQLNSDSLESILNFVIPSSVDNN